MPQLVGGAGAAQSTSEIGYLLNRSTKTLQVVTLSRGVGRGASGRLATVQSLGTVGGFRDPVDVGSGAGVAVVVDLKAKGIVKIDAVTLEKIGTLTTGKSTRSVAVTPDGTTALVLVKKKNLLVVDLRTMQVTRKLRVGKGAEDVVIDDTGTLAATVNVKSRNVSVIDVASAQQRSSLRANPVHNYAVPCTPAAFADATTMGGFLHVGVACADNLPGSTMPALIDLYGSDFDALGTYPFELMHVPGTPRAVATHPDASRPAGFNVSMEEAGAVQTYLFGAGGDLVGSLGAGRTFDDAQVIGLPGLPGSPPDERGAAFFEPFCPSSGACELPLPPQIFADGFESGDVTAWSSTPQ